MFAIFTKSNKTEVGPTAYIFIGRSGSGKGTQVKLLKQTLKEKYTNKILHVETGALLREFIKGSLHIEKLVKERMDTGGLVPDPMAVATWVNYMTDHFTGKEIMLFDGAPRKVGEAQFLDSMLQFCGVKKYVVINVEVSRAECTKRLIVRYRADDTTAGIESRMDWYDSEVLPCIEYFRNNKNAHVIDLPGEGSIDAVHAELVKELFV